MSGQFVEIPNSENDGPWRWRLTSPLPERLGPPEDPNIFLPATLTDDQCTRKNVAYWKARSGIPLICNDLVIKYIVPRLGIVDKKEQEKAATRINKRDQEYQAKHCMLGGNFKVFRKEKGKTEKEVPKQVRAVAEEMLSDA